MSARLNLSLLRTLKNPMVGILGEVSGQLNTLLEGQGLPSPWPALEEVRTLEGGLSLAGSRGLSRIVATLIESMEVIVVQVESKGDVLFLQNLIRSTIQMIQSLMEHLESLARGEGLESVLLWPYLDSLSRSLNHPSPAPEVLFEPGAPVLPDRSGRKKASKADIRKATALARTQLQSSVEILSVSEEKIEIESALKNIQKTLESLGGLRPQSEFQAYWVALRGSAALAQMDIPSFLAHREEWLHRFKNGIDIVESFGADGRHVDESHLYDAIWPLLREHPPTWSMLNPVIAETEELFGLRAFKEAAQEAKDTEFQRLLEIFRSQRSMIREILSNMQQVWDKVIAKKATKADFVHASSSLLANHSLFPGAALNPLFDSLKVVIDRFNSKPQEPIDDQLSEELATSILVLLDAVDLGGRWGEDVEAQVRLQKSRLDLALTRRFAELVGLPRTRSIQIISNERGRTAEYAVIREVRHNLQHIRALLEGLWDGDEDALRQWSSVFSRVDEMEGALGMLHQTAASKVVSRLRPHLSAMENEGPRRDESYRQGIRDQLGALQAFLSSWEVGDNDAALRLTAVLGEKNAEIDADRREQGGLVDAPSLDFEPQISIEADIEEGQKQQEKESGPIQPPVSKEPAVEEAVLEEAVLEEAVLEEAVLEEAVLEEAVLENGGWDESSYPEISEAFLEESLEILDTMGQELIVLSNIGDMKDSRSDEALRTIRRGFHTLKGSGMLSGFTHFGYAAKIQEEALEERLNYPGQWDDEQSQWVHQVVAQMRLWWKELNTHGKALIDLSLLSAPPVWGTELVSNEESEDVVAEIDDLDSIFEEDVDTFVSESSTLDSLPSSTDEEGHSPQPEPSESLGTEDKIEDAEDQKILAEEIEGYITTLRAYGEGDSSDFDAYRALHNVVGLGREHHPLQAWLSLAEVLHEQWNQSGGAHAPPHLSQEACLVLSVDLNRTTQGKSSPERHALISSLSEKQVNPATQGDQSTSKKSEVDWSLAWKALEGMGDNLQTLVEAFSAHSSSTGSDTDPDEEE